MKLPGNLNDLKLLLNWAMISAHTREKREGTVNYWGTSHLSLLGNVYAKFLEKYHRTMNLLQGGYLVLFPFWPQKNNDMLTPNKYSRNLGNVQKMPTLVLSTSQTHMAMSP